MLLSETGSLFQVTNSCADGCCLARIVSAVVGAVAPLQPALLRYTRATGESSDVTEPTGGGGERGPDRANVNLYPALPQTCLYVSVLSCLLVCFE